MRRGGKCVHITAVLAQSGLLFHPLHLSPPSPCMTHSHCTLRFIHPLLELFLHVLRLLQKGVLDLGKETVQIYILVCKNYYNKSHKLSSLNNVSLFPHSSRIWNSKIKVWAGLVSSEDSLFGLQMAAFSLHPSTVILQCV